MLVAVDGSVTWCLGPCDISTEHRL